MFQALSKSVLALSLGLSMSASTLAATNLLVNGDFEDGQTSNGTSFYGYPLSTPNGWSSLTLNLRFGFSVYASNEPLMVGRPDYPAPVAASGSHLVAVGGYLSSASSGQANADSWKYLGLYQDLAVNAGDTLTVNYSAMTPSTDAVVAWLIDTASNTVLASTFGQPVVAGTTWKQVSFSTTALSNSVRLVINDGAIFAFNRPYVDNVSVTATSTVPEPSTWATMALGLVGLAFGVKRRSARS